MTIRVPFHRGRVIDLVDSHWWSSGLASDYWRPKTTIKNLNWNVLVVSENSFTIAKPELSKESKSWMPNNLYQHEIEQIVQVFRCLFTSFFLSDVVENGTKKTRVFVFLFSQFRDSSLAAQQAAKLLCKHFDFFARSQNCQSLNSWNQGPNR